jgi:hypothetical protein
MNKQLLILLLFILISISITGCNKSTNNNDKSDAPIESCTKGQKLIWSKCDCAMECMDEVKANDPLRIDCDRECRYK